MHLLLFSSSKLAGYPERFAYAREKITEYLADIHEITFVPYALKDHEMYTSLVRDIFLPYGKTVRSVHTFKDPTEAIETAECIFVGGGNTFLLLDTLYKTNLIETIRTKVLSGTKYMGVSAGSNVACPTIMTTNDMPIIYPPSFNALGLVPFQINAHFIDTDPHSTHMGETREDRLREYHEQNNLPVLGLREGAFIEVRDETCLLGGLRGAKLFKSEQIAVELTAGSVINEFI